MSRHPSSFELAAFFDGEEAGKPEPSGGVGAHVASCRRCRNEVARLGRIRAAVRGELVPVDGGNQAWARWVRRWPAALMPVAAAVLLLLALAIPPGGLPVTQVDELSGEAPQLPAAPTPAPPAPVSPAEPSVRAAAKPASPPAAAAAAAGANRGPRLSAADQTGPPAPSGVAPPAGPHASVPAAGPPGHTSASPASPPALGAQGPTPASVGLRLGVSVPTHGPAASEGQEVLRAVRAVADSANEAGGVGGRKVDVILVPTDDDAAQRIALTRIDALAGGFAIRAPAGIPWVVPADVEPAGPDVVAGEVTAEQAGEVLGAELATRDLAGPAGAIVGQGPDAAFAAGLAKAVPVERVAAAPGTECDDEVDTLRRHGVSALAVAGPPELARNCAQAAAHVGWRPPGGLLMAPSAAYAHLELSFPAQGARTVLGFPSPRADHPGASRYRRTVSYSGAYRALVSFAAAELALDVARATGSVAAEPVRTRHWKSDLYDLDSGRNASPRVVTARFARWSED